MLLLLKRVLEHLIREKDEFLHIKVTANYLRVGEIVENAEKFLPA